MFREGRLKIHSVNTGGFLSGQDLHFPVISLRIEHGQIGVPDTAIVFPRRETDDVVCYFRLSGSIDLANFAELRIFAVHPIQQDHGSRIPVILIVPEEEGPHQFFYFARIRRCQIRTENADIRRHPIRPECTIPHCAVPEFRRGHGFRRRARILLVERSSAIIDGIPEKLFSRILDQHHGMSCGTLIEIVIIRCPVKTVLPQIHDLVSQII